MIPANSLKITQGMLPGSDLTYFVLGFWFERAIDANVIYDGGAHFVRVASDPRRGEYVFDGSLNFYRFCEADRGEQVVVCVRSKNNGELTQALLIGAAVDHAVRIGTAVQ